MSEGLSEDSVSLNDSFGGDGSTATQDTGIAAAEETPADAPVEETSGDVDAMGDGVAEPEQVPAAPVAVAPPAAPPAPPPLDPRYLEMQAQAQKPVNDFFAMMNRRAAEQQQQQVVAQQRQQQQYRLQQLESMKPAMPDPNTATPQDLLTYAGKMQEYGAARSRMEVMDEVKQMLAQEMDQKLAPLKELQAKAMQDEATRNEQFVSGSIQRLVSDARYPFMQNPVVQNAFLSHWWASNEKAGAVLDPSQVMADFVAVQRAFSAPAAVKVRTDQQNLDANRRNLQQKNGAPSVPRATSSQSGVRGNGKPAQAEAPGWLK